ncbi:MAG: hypothetical protein ACTHJM_01200 [Marmoricola sp.]|jgi:hypothetical protein
MSYKMLSPNTRIDWIPASGIADPVAGPTLTELNAGTNISAAIVTGFKLAAKDSDVDNSRTIVDEGVVDTPTAANYEGSLSFYLDPVGGTPSVYTTAVGLFKGGPVFGYLVSRQGKKFDQPYAAGDVFSYFYFQSEDVKIDDSDSKSTIKASVDFLPQGVFALNKVAA